MTAETELEKLRTAVRTALIIHNVVGDDEEGAFQVCLDELNGLVSDARECQHINVDQLKDRGEYGYSTGTDWAWCSTCGSLQDTYYKERGWRKPTYLK